MNVSDRPAVARQIAGLLLLLSTAAACRPERVMPYHASLGLSRQEYIDACNHKPGARMRLYGCAKWVSELRPGPMFVVDGRVLRRRVTGWPFRRRYSTPIQIHADSIAAIEVMKGSAAVARYGNGAKNGVVVITTKRKAAAMAAEEPASLAGCYELSLGSWSRALGGNAAYHRLPLSVRLDTAGAARGGWVLRPDIAYPYGNRLRGFPRWTATADSVAMTWSNGFQSTLVRAARRPNGDLTGEAIVGSDANEFGNDLPRAAVVARRTACTESE